MSLLENTLAGIGRLYEDPMRRARQRLDSLLKPPGSLGRLEDLAIQIAGITGNERLLLRDKCIIVMAGDHGVWREGISAASQEVTHQILPAFVNGVGGIGVLARHAGARLVVVDMGVAVPVEYPGVIVKKVRYGTDNIAEGPAMTRQEAVKALEAGIEIAVEEISRGADLLAVGDMGIGNTTPSSAILSCLGGYAAEEVTGRGTQVNDDVLKRKISVVDRAINVNRPDPSDGVDVLAKIGGLEIGGLAGVILGAASKRVPVLIDGFITTAAAMIAAAIKPESVSFMIPSHLSGEHGHKLMLRHLKLQPLIYLDMRLGEGTGAALAMHLVEAAAKIINEMASFKDAGVSDMDKDKLVK